MTSHRENFKKATKTCREKDIPPFTKEFGKCVREKLKELKGE